MKYLVKSDKISDKELYVADTHSFDIEGKQIITLTDIKEYSQDFNLDEAVDFIKKNPTFTIEENKGEEFDLVEEEEDE